MFQQQQIQTVTTEKYLPFQISRVRLAPIFGTQTPPLVLTGTFQEEVNSLCAWQYRPSATYANNFLNAPLHDSGLPSVLADSEDEPRLACSVVHPGDVQQLKVHTDSQLVFTGSSMGFVGIYRLAVPKDTSDVFSLSKLHFWTRTPKSDCDNSDDDFIPQDVPISDVSFSADASQLYVGDDLGQLTVLDTETLVPKVKTAVSARGFDVATINAIEVIDDECIATANQVGQLNLWDLRSPLRDNLPQRRIIPAASPSSPPESAHRSLSNVNFLASPSATTPLITLTHLLGIQSANDGLVFFLFSMGEPRPLVCLSQHPGQPHLLAVGGINSHVVSNKKSTSTCYIWDLRADQHPLSELDCPGTAVWEIKFHPTQPQQLYLATEEAGLVRVQSTSPSESWSYMEGARKKLSAVCAMQKPTGCCSVHTFDLLGGLLICGRDNGVLQTIQDPSTSVFSFA
ncbi:unnamed protein product [Schistocephalus solidus]|uniref:WD_REPEATS_REGION domain-containing protein n=1 Tax=Schistocephalus solidus TaxID=70667 RepID=A0A183SGB9_SCHSO|nr:unnamed protein product [Schistocephalus solidus]